jgi:pentose-5-phosphate-3-epimerase
MACTRELAKGAIMNNRSIEPLTSIDLVTLTTVTGGFPGEGFVRKVVDKTKKVVKQGVDFVRNHPEYLIMGARR